jgi:hypothetical protein
MDNGIYEDYPERVPEGGLEVVPQHYANQLWAQQQQHQQSYVPPFEKDTQPDLPVPQPTHDPADAPRRIGGLKPVSFWCSRVAECYSDSVFHSSLASHARKSRRSLMRSDIFRPTPHAFADSIAAATGRAHATYRRQYMGPG